MTPDFSHLRDDEPIILICNDDGIGAPGIQALAEAVHGLGQLIVVAPIEEQSAVGHAITIRTPVRAYEWAAFKVDVEAAYAVTGTPADCIKLAVSSFLPRKPDLVVSGINQGPNTAVNVIYSGTVSAATEASILGIDAIAFSYCHWTADDYTPSKQVARRVAEQVLAKGLPPGIGLNVNIPAIPGDQIKGVQVTRQARSRWEESYQARVDPFERPYYWLSGEFVNLDDGERTDLEAINAGFVSITPIQHDLTAHRFIDELEQWGL
ncbi:MAG: 5'/3'-nucleotidase SurE [Rhodothermales bacterium]